jgi:hypothetical protein
MALKKRSTGALTANATVTVGLGAAFGKVVGYDVSASADTTTAWAVVDARGKTIATVGSADYTTLTAVNLTAETASTEDGTAATGNAGAIDGVIAQSPLTVTLTNLTTGTATISFFVEV